MLTARRLGTSLIGGLLPLVAACGDTAESPAATPTIEATPAAQTTLTTPTTAAESQAKTQATAAPTTLVATATSAAATATQPPAASPTEAASPTSAAKTDGTSGDPRQSIAQAYASSGQSENFRMAGIIEEAGTTQEITAEFSSPERVRLTTAEGEVRIVDDVMYAQGPDGQWLGLRGVTPDQQTGDLFDLDRAQQDLDTASDFRRIGTETLNGVPTTIYEYTQPQNGQQEITRVWVSESEGRVRKIETQTNGTTRTFLFSDYGEIPEITAPEGAQVLNAGQPGQNLPVQPPTGIPGGN
ncbi:MAG TPA: hypothetical protein VGW38_09030 [Chloroflexota bacterium]|nr:hypothetical protein [Chloroflexota bacterium]